MIMSEIGAHRFTKLRILLMAFDMASSHNFKYYLIGAMNEHNATYSVERER